MLKINVKEISAEMLLISSRLFTFEDKTEDAESCMKQSIESFEGLGDDYLIARALYYQGLMQTESGRKSDAGASFDRARVIFTRIEAKGWLTRMNRTGSPHGVRPCILTNIPDNS